MTAFTQAQQAVAEMRTQFAERFTPELRTRIALFAFTSLAIGLLAVCVLSLLKATYEPLAWTVLVLIGAAYGWNARTDLTVPRPRCDDLTVIYLDIDEEEND